MGGLLLVGCLGDCAAANFQKHLCATSFTMPYAWPGLLRQKFRGVIAMSNLRFSDAELLALVVAFTDFRPRVLRRIAIFSFMIRHHLRRGGVC